MLYSKSLNRYYVGESENATLRLELHNNHHFKNSFTNVASDWKSYSITNAIQKMMLYTLKDS
ncbi:hypothetical protein [Gaetbulibacter sp. NE]|uniref:hypothetical protein n=1 Tax=unclassified Gaetbulibacter TaxID=2625143 RepID=UPI0021D06006